MASASAIAARVRAREISAVSVVEEALARIARHNAVVNAIVTLAPHALDEPLPACGEVRWTVRV